jgi:sodium transport system ATP-binding protein
MIEVHQLTKHFKKVHAVDGVDFAAQDGQVLGLLGANGAGKTTTMRIIAAMLQPTSGTVKVGGFDVARHPNDVRRILGVMPENWGLYPHLTPRDHLRFYGELFRLDESTLNKKIDGLIDELEMGEYADRKCEDFSKGMKQKTSLARTLLHEPKHLLLDEPTSGLDVMSARQVRRLVRNLRDKGCCVIISTHILSEAERMCDTIVLMDKGKKVAEGSVDELLQKAGKTTLEDAFVTLIGREDAEVE